MSITTKVAIARGPTPGSIFKDYLASLDVQNTSKATGALSTISTNSDQQAGTTFEKCEVKFSDIEKPYSSTLFIPKGVWVQPAVRLPKAVFKCVKTAAHIAHVLQTFLTISFSRQGENVCKPSLVHLFAHWYPLVTSGTWVAELKFHLCYFFAKESTHIDTSEGGLPKKPDGILHKDGYFLPGKYMRILRCQISRNKRSFDFDGAHGLLFGILNGIKKGMPTVDKDMVDREIFNTIIDLSSVKDQPVDHDLETTLWEVCRDDALYIKAECREKEERRGKHFNITRGSCAQSSFSGGGGMGFVLKQAVSRDSLAQTEEVRGKEHHVTGRTSRDVDANLQDRLSTTPVHGCPNRLVYEYDGERKEEIEELAVVQHDWYVTYWREEIKYLLAREHVRIDEDLIAQDDGGKPSEDSFSDLCRLKRLNAEACKGIDGREVGDLFILEDQVTDLSGGCGEVLLKSRTVEINQRANIVSFVGIREPLKVRPISKSNFFLNSLWHDVQSVMWSKLYALPQFKLIGEPMNESHVNWLMEQSLKSYTNGCELGALPSEDEFVFCSGDYKGATNTIFQWVTETVIDAWFDEEWVKKLVKGNMLKATLKGTFGSGVSEEEMATVDSLGGHTREAVKGDDIYLPQRIGQLMGSLFSFPILCVINYAVNLLHLREVTNDPYLELRPLSAPVLINGDDNASLLRRQTYARWQFNIGRAGFFMSVGKNYLARNFCFLNSKLFWVDWVRYQSRELPFLNMGILYGEKKTAVDMELSHMSVSECAAYDYIHPFVVQSQFKVDLSVVKEVLDGRKDLPRGKINAFEYATGIDASTEVKKYGWIRPAGPGRLGPIGELIQGLGCFDKRSELLEKMRKIENIEKKKGSLSLPKKKELQLIQRQLKELLGGVYARTIVPLGDGEFCCAHCQEFQDIMDVPSYHGQFSELTKIHGLCLHGSIAHSVVKVHPEFLAESELMCDIDSTLFQ